MQDEGDRELPGAIANRYKPIREIGVGPVCTVYEGLDEQDGGPVAIKIDEFHSDRPLTSPLAAEYRALVGLENTAGIPRALFYQDAREDNHSILVLDLLGPSLEHLRELCGGKFSLKTVCLIAKQMLSRLQSMHEKSYVHCYLMPSSLVLAYVGADCESKNLIYLVGFGFSRHFTEAQDDDAPSRDIVDPFPEAPGLSRKDDLDSLGLLLAYFLQEGSWDEVIKVSNRENTDRNVESSPVIFADFPVQFSMYMSYIHDLSTIDSPDYDYLRSLFDQVLMESNEPDDGVYDWMLLNDGAGWDMSEGKNQGIKEARVSSDSFLDYPAIFAPAGLKLPKRPSDILLTEKVVQGDTFTTTRNINERHKTGGSSWYKSFWKGGKKGVTDQSQSDSLQAITPTQVSASKERRRLLARRKRPETPTSVHSEDLTDDDDNDDSTGGVDEAIPLVDVLCFCLCFSRKTRRSKA